MKGSLKTVLNKYHNCSKTHFDDWSDPQCKTLKKVLQPLRVSIRQDKGEEDGMGIKVDFVTTQTSIEIDQLRHKIKCGYPLLSQKEIRNIKLPFYQSLLLNLKEDGFIATSQFISDLINMDEKWHAQRENNASIKNRFLKFNTTALNALLAGLTKAELAKLENHHSQELKNLLELALHFSKPEDYSWHWMAEELFEQCMGVAGDESKVVDEELKAIAKHAYATFLLDVLYEPRRAKLLVDESMKLSEGKTWNANKITGIGGDTLYFESCLLLHKLFLVMANEVRECDIEEAILLCRSSLHWAKMVSDKKAEGTALINLVTIYMKAHQHEPVLGYLESYMKICVELNDVHGLCEGYILKSDYHELLGNEAAVVNSVQELLKVAEDSGILKMIALAHRKLAIFYLIQQKQQEMQYHAVKAYTYSATLNSKSEVEDDKCLTGIAQAQEIMLQYITLLLDAEDSDTAEFKVLMLWKSLNIPFFTNVKLFHPEAKMNEDLKDTMESTKNDEVKAAYKSRQNEMKSLSHMSLLIHSFPSTSRGLTRGSTIGSSRNISRSISNFQKQVRSANKESDTLSMVSKF